MRQLRTGVSALGVMLAVLPVVAHAGRLDLGGEVRADGRLSFGSSGQFGTLAGTGPCGGTPYLPPTTDGGGDISASATALLTSAKYRHQLTLSLGYSALYCTPQLRRPVGGVDYRGEHALSERTRLSGGARFVFDVFGRDFDTLAGNLINGMMPAPTTMPVALGESAGIPFMLGQANVELTHAFSKLYGLRAIVHLSSLEVLGQLNQLPDYSTLGPMEAVQFSLIGAREANRDRFELPLRYRVSSYYARTWLSIRTRSQVPAAHDLQLSPAWERKLTPKLTLHVEAGGALAVQPHLCVQIDPLLIAADRCSIDARAPGVRGYDGRAPAEASIGRLGSLTPAGEVSLIYVAPRRRFELHFIRGYEPEPYAGALSLINRLSGDMRWRPLWALLFYGNAQLLYSSQTTPARVSVQPDGLLLQPLSPQNRTLLMAMGVAGAEYHVRGPLSVFFETNFQALKIRGERVPQIPSQSPYLYSEVTPFATGSAVVPGPGGMTSPTDSYIPDPFHVTFILGVRGQWDTLPSRQREPDLFTEARAVP